MPIFDTLIVMNEQNEAKTKQNVSTDESLKWQLVSSEHIVKDEWIDFRREAYRFPDGTLFEPFYSYSRKSYVVIVARTEEGKYLCVRQFRQGIGKVTTEFPAGGLEKEEMTDDPVTSQSAPRGALNAAKRELREETGYESSDWTFLLSVPSNATLADNYAFLFFADNCRRSSGQDLDDTEFLDALLLSASEIDEMIRNGQFQQAIHILAWLLHDGK